MPVVIRWAQYVPLVEIGLTDLPKSGGAMAPLTPLVQEVTYYTLIKLTL